MTTVAGVGLGLRWEFLDALLGSEGRAAVDFLEIAPENYLRRGGRQVKGLTRLAERYPIVTHGLSMSLGGADPLDGAYLADLARLLRDLRTPWHSDHLCFSSSDGRALHELLPVALTAETAARVSDRVRRAEDALRVPMAIENVSYYWHPGRAEMGEAELLARVCEEAQCGLLLDVNNAYVNATNFALDVDAWMRAAPLDRVVQIHVAGHEWFAVDEGGLGEPAAAGAAGAMIVDTHGASVPDPVLALLERVLLRTGPVPVVLERDRNIPSLSALLEEVQIVRAICERCARVRASAVPSPPSPVPLG